MTRLDEIRERLEAAYREGFSAPWVDDISYLMGLLDELRPHLPAADRALRLWSAHMGAACKTERRRYADTRLALERIKKELT